MKIFCGAVFYWKSGVDRKTVHERIIIRYSTAVNANEVKLSKWDFVFSNQMERKNERWELATK
ncbi:MAG: hypothetical protein M0Q21_12150 [Ignavibacteriaceae bacterium]|nr:hypothetical protein [Ignavibacteriaceae bacterium]